jgi:hypothetical protein
MKALGIAAATAIALAPFSAVATTPGVAQAACAGVFANPTSCENCLHYVEVYHTSNVCDKAQALPGRVPVQTTEAPPEPALPSVTPVQTTEAPPEPPLPSVTPVQSPQVVPPSPPLPSTIPVAAHEEPTQPTQPWWPVALGWGVFAIAMALAAYGARI